MKKDKEFRYYKHKVHGHLYRIKDNRMEQYFGNSWEHIAGVTLGYEPLYATRLSRKEAFLEIL